MNYFRFGSNYILFDQITAVKCSLYANQHHGAIDQMVVFLTGGHEVPVPAMEQGKFLHEFQSYLDDLNRVDEEDGESGPIDEEGYNDLMV